MGRHPARVRRRWRRESTVCVGCDTAVVSVWDAASVLLLIGWMVTGPIVTGCAPDLGRFAVHDGGALGLDGDLEDGPTADARAVDGRPTDRGPPDAVADAPAPDRPNRDGGSGPGCGRPQLLAAVEDLTNPSTRGGRVLRFELDDDLGSWRRCDDLDAGGRLIDQPTAVGMLDNGTVVVAGWGGVDAIDPDTNQVQWHRDDTRQAGSVIPLTDPEDGEQLAVVSWLDEGATPDVRELVAYTSAGVPRHTWTLNSTELPLGLGVKAIAASPLHGDRLLATKPSDYAAAEADPFAGTGFRDPPYVRTRAGLQIRSLSSLRKDALDILVWAGTLDSNEGVFYVADTTGEADRSLLGPIDCPGRDEEHVTAVADPTAAGVRFFAVLGDLRTRHVVRFTPQASNPGDCEVAVTDGDAGGFDARISALAVAP